MDGRNTALLRRVAPLWENWRQHSLFWPLAIILGLLLLVQLVRLILLLITPVSPLGDWQPNQAKPMPMAARSAILTSYNPFDGSSAAGSSDNRTEAVTALDLQLYGIRINNASGGGSAIIAGSDGVQESYAIGDEIMSGVSLAAVEFDHVVLDRNGKRESLFIDQSGDTKPVSPPMAITETSAGKVISRPAEGDSNAAPAQARAAALNAGIGFTPRSEDGKVTGIAVASQGDGTAFKQFGFQPGDVIVEYDGRPVRSADDVTAMIAKSRPGGRFSVMVERGGQILPIAIIVPEQ
ncbi:type II secretion system protein N [Alterisphingorhabdus coralli]|uniref:Type II secretion system protein N n=1 Tax=Alterisphingorhabdus coralli TaxID=3071408 RepID=A0AA97FA34_9SPHN|nr:type II secretion system protein N [Parasphingorhabdus sp. SCSIO 66989]WOE75837.1 type II secretion system protein N [Parasphingorhabdus sp. SCSIO 66989]